MSVGTSFQQFNVNKLTSRRMSQSAVSLQHLRHPRGREPTIHPEGKRRRARRLDSHKNISTKRSINSAVLLEAQGSSSKGRINPSVRLAAILEASKESSSQANLSGCSEEDYPKNHHTGSFYKKLQ